MAPLLRSTLTCFYCGCRSAQVKEPSLRKWHCEKCEAENYLDEKGEITDPPAVETTSSNARYAQSIQRPTSPIFDTAQDSLFCQTCLKNQHLLTESLAHYYPPPSAPDFDEYEKAYPEYRASLEDRYPQCCEDCEPRVRARLKATTYAAKTDHLGRMMERTRLHGVPRDHGDLNRWLVFLGGLMWCMSLVGQLLWDGLGLLPTAEVYDGLLEETPLLTGCARRSAISWELTPSCSTHVDNLGALALVLGLVSVWWNPRIQEKLSRRRGRIVGKSEYYKMQFILLAGRCAVWAWITRSNSEVQGVNAVHLFMIVFTLLCFFTSFRAVGTDYTSRLLFQESPEPLIVRKTQRNKITTSQSSGEVPSSFQNDPRGSQSIKTPRFPIDALASPSLQQVPSAYQPPTPPPEDDEDEAMDWTPSQSTLPPASPYRVPSAPPQESQQPRFRGHLPPDIVSPAHRLRNPPNQPTFRKASAKTKQNFFNHSKEAFRNVDVLSEDTNEPSPAKSIFSNLSPTKFANPKFFPNSDFASDTGLENIFTSAFSLAEEPAEIQSVRQRRTKALQSQHQSRKLVLRFILAEWHRFLALLSLLTALSFWLSSPKPSLAAYAPHFRVAALAIPAALAIRSMIMTLLTDASSTDLFLFTFEIAISILLAAGFRNMGPFVYSSADFSSSTGTGLLLFMLAQELWMLWLDYLHSDDGTYPTQQQLTDAHTSTAAPRQKPQRFTRSTATRAVDNSTSGLGELSIGNSNGSGDRGFGIAPTPLHQRLPSRRSNRNGVW